MIDVMPNLIRDGQKVWPTCPECGCRLSCVVLDSYVHMVHFGTSTEKDARGCRCSLVNRNFWVEESLVGQSWE